MITELFVPTDEQRAIIEHDKSAFISACPGSGKTRVMVERARVLLSRPSCYGIAFLSFTNAAVSELEGRLIEYGVLPSPTFPHFIGTFDGFIWQFIVCPFGVPGCTAAPHLIPDKDNLTIRPSDKVQALPLRCFDRSTGSIIPKEAARFGYQAEANGQLTKSYETIAKRSRAKFLERGEIDFSDARDIARGHLNDAKIGPLLAPVLRARFGELIVDEAQDCNPADLEIIGWMRDAGIVVKVICDPHQSIYEFRGGVTDDLINFSKTFGNGDQLSMSGNFRSGKNICKSIVALREKGSRANVDQPLGKYKDEPTGVYVLSYSSKDGVPKSIGGKFKELIEALDLNAAECPVLAATRSSGCRAIGQTPATASKEMSVRLADTIADFHFSNEVGVQRAGLEKLHRIVLELEGHLADVSYHQYLKAQGIDHHSWRPRVLNLLRDLRYDPTKHGNADGWLENAKTLLSPYLPAGGKTIGQKLRKNDEIATVLACTPACDSPANTIHAVKGMEFPAVCVVMTSQKAKGILDYLETGETVEYAEDSREIYVAASRAERLLVIAVPKSQAKRMVEYLSKTGAVVTLIQL